MNPERWQIVKKVLAGALDRTLSLPFALRYRVAFEGALLGPTPVRAGAGELPAFTDRGYSAAFAVLGIHRWFHTLKDTIECTDARLVTPVLQAHQRTIELLLAKR